VSWYPKQNYLASGNLLLTGQKELSMSETIAIILHFHEEDAEYFESAFKTNVYPLWEDFKAQGKFISASLTPVTDGSEMKEGIRDYILHVEVPSRAEHDEFDSEPRFLPFLEKFQPLQPEEPKVWLGNTLFQI
jgi:hypothetical protein